MRRIIYASQATRDLRPDELEALLQTCRRRNAASGLSGMLLYSSQSFLQVIEGEPMAVRATYERILRDDLHDNIRKLLDTEVSSALFPDWSMGFEHVDHDRLAAELDGHAPYPLSDPQLVRSPSVARTLLFLYARNSSVTQAVA